MRHTTLIVIWICAVEIRESITSTFSLGDPEIDKWTENGDIETEEIKRNIEVRYSSYILLFYDNKCVFTTDCTS